jgi:hypothetical protein
MEFEPLRAMHVSFSGHHRNHSHRDWENKILKLKDEKDKVKSFEATEKGMSQETTDKVYKLPGTI